MEMFVFGTLGLAVVGSVAWMMLGEAIAQARLRRLAIGAMWQGRGELPGGIVCLASWNVARAPEGAAPTFQHYKWVLAGYINADVADAWPPDEGC